MMLRRNTTLLLPLFPQLENLGNFIKAILAYGLKPNDIFEANDLFENGNMTQVQTTLLALASMVRLQSPSILRNLSLTLNSL